MPATLKLRFRADVTNNIPTDHEIQLNLAMRDAVADATHFGAALTAANTPKRTGRTAASVRASVSGGGSSVAGSFGSDYPVLEYLERGTRPHIIRPRFKKALFWPGARHPVGKVRHPGTVAQHTLEHSAEAAGAYAKEKLGGVFGEVFG
jgi:hypothetical protein